MTSIREKDAQRDDYLIELYKWKERDGQGALTNMFDVGEALGFDQSTTNEVVDFLKGEMLVKIVAVGPMIDLTHKGRVAVENYILKLEEKKDNRVVDDGDLPGYQ